MAEGAVLAAASPAPGGINALRVPARLLAAGFAKEQVPINQEEERHGASFDTIERPIGDRQSSPMVCRIYSANNHHIDNFTELSTPFTAMAMTTYPRQSRSRP